MVCDGGGGGGRGVLETRVAVCGSEYGSAKFRSFRDAQDESLEGLHTSDCRFASL
jgi:hypothetical protein